VANREKIELSAPVANTVANDEDDDDFLDDIDRGKSSHITKIGKGWRLETNSDGRLRWRWQVKDDDDAPVTYVNDSGKTVYVRGSYYVGITQAGWAREQDKKRRKGRHKRG
jgi:hypothetical protein